MQLRSLITKRIETFCTSVLSTDETRAIIRECDPRETISIPLVSRGYRDVIEVLPARTDITLGKRMQIDTESPL